MSDSLLKDRREMIRRIKKWEGERLAIFRSFGTKGKVKSRVLECRTDLYWFVVGRRLIVSYSTPFTVDQINQVHFFEDEACLLPRKANMESFGLVDTDTYEKDGLTLVTRQSRKYRNIWMLDSGIACFLKTENECKDQDLINLYIKNWGLYDE